ncbi:alkaline phosphatase family protein [Achromobacter kerstersii]|uniref:alkaline phosphatase family protein n=1 Tax=Achromobacter kerstersii TaxID=1353890 RepID=UPI003209B753
MKAEHPATSGLARTPANPALRAVLAHRGRGAAAWGRLAATAMLSLALTACGGNDDDSEAGAPQPETPATPQPPAASVNRHALVIDMDSAVYHAVQSGLAAGTLPNLARLQVQLAYSGGVAGTPSQQPTLDVPGWATLLTGTWANRHGVISNAPVQALRTATLFQQTKAKSTGLNGAAVASAELAQLLVADHDAGYLDTMADCSDQASTMDCVSGQAVQMIGSGYRTVVAQFRSAKDAALDYGVGSPHYTATLAKLDRAVGAMLDETTKLADSQWLIVVTGNHGLSGNSQDDGLPLVPESATFIGLNQATNNGTQGIGAPVPAALADLYGYASIADVAPTVLGYLNALPVAAQYALDGGSLLGPQPVSNLSAAVADNNSSSVNVVLSWTAPSDRPIDVLRDGRVIASRLPAGTTTYTDNQLTADLTAKGTYQFAYTVQAGEGDTAASRGIISPPVSYTPPVPLAATLRNGLVSYYPFSATLPPVDAQGNSTMGPASSDLPASAGLVVPGPFAGTNGLLVDTNFVTTSGLEGYRLIPANGFDVSKGTAPQFTIGFWFKAPECVPRSNVTILSNKNYVSGGNAGVAIGMFSSSGNQCGIAFNIGSGGVRADGPTSPYTQITVGRWIYIAFSVDGVAKTMNMVVFDSVTGMTNRVATGKSTGAVDMSKLSPYPQWGIGEDGTGTYLMNKCGATPPYTVGQCTTAPPYQQMFGDLAMWNRVLTDSELQSLFLSNKPLSTLPAQ